MNKKGTASAAVRMSNRRVVVAIPRPDGSGWNEFHEVLGPPDVLNTIRTVVLLGGRPTVGGKFTIFEIPVSLLDEVVFEERAYTPAEPKYRKDYEG